MTSPSTERPTAIASGAMLPLEKAYSEPAMPAASEAATKPAHCTRRASMPSASARRAESRTPRSAAQRREREPSQPPDAQRAQRQRQVVVAGTAAQPGGGPQAGESVAAAGDVVPLEGGGPQDLRHGQRQHGQVDAGQAHAEPAEHQRAQRRGQRPQQQRGLHRQRAERAAAPRRRRPGRTRRRGRNWSCRPARSGNAGWRRTARRSGFRSAGWPGTAIAGPAAAPRSTAPAAPYASRRRLPAG